MNMPLYPMAFEPVYIPGRQDDTIMAEFLRHRVQIPAKTQVSWECADTPEVVSAIANGPAKGQLFSDLVQHFPFQIVGRRHSAGKRFPLSVRLVEIDQRTPLMVHPSQTVQLSNNQIAGPNNKFWFALHAKEQAVISVGIQMGVTGMQVLQNLGSPELEKLLQQFTTRPGDSFFIPNKRMHSAGAGNLIWELQEQPAAPLRVSTWYNTSSSDISQEEQQAALQHAAFQDRQLSRISKEAGSITHTRKIPLVHYCPRFAIDEIRLHDHCFDRTDGSSFHLLGVVKGRIVVLHKDECLHLQQGSVACIPAVLGDYRIYVETGETATLLRVTLQPL